MKISCVSELLSRIHGRLREPFPAGAPLVCYKNTRLLVHQNTISARQTSVLQVTTQPPIHDASQVHYQSVCRQNPLGARLPTTAFVSQFSFSATALTRHTWPHASSTSMSSFPGKYFASSRSYTSRSPGCTTSHWHWLASTPGSARSCRASTMARKHSGLSSTNTGPPPLLLLSSSGRSAEPGWRRRVACRAVMGSPPTSSSTKSSAGPAAAL